MTTESGFGTVARHTAVQVLAGACYAENLRIASAVLFHRRPECSCMRDGDSTSPAARLPLEKGDRERLAACCGACRQALEEAALAWESGDMETLRAKLQCYREAHARVRSELLNIAH